MSMQKITAKEVDVIYDDVCKYEKSEAQKKGYDVFFSFTQIYIELHVLYVCIERERESNSSNNLSKTKRRENVSVIVE